MNRWGGGETCKVGREMHEGWRNAQGGIEKRTGGGLQRNAHISKLVTKKKRHSNMYKDDTRAVVYSPLYMLQ